MSFKVPQLSSLRTQISGSTWTRPSDWITITDATGEVQFLVNDIGSAIFTLRTNYTKPAAQNLYIDWGDGVTTTISAIGITNTAHTYSIGTGTACTLGYTTFKIRVYVDSGATISQCQFIQGTVNGVTQLPWAPIGVLEAYYGESLGITNYGSYFYSPSSSGDFSGVGFSWLKYVKLPANCNSVTSFGGTFQYCYNLARVTMPTAASSLTDITYMFNQCKQIETITLPSNATSITGLVFSFYFCSNLTSVTLPPTLNSVTNCFLAFGFCGVLKNMTLPSMNSCVAYDGIFNSCYNIENIKFTSWTSTAQAISLTDMFGNCYNLTGLIWPTTAFAGTTFTGGTINFTNCYALQSMTFPSYFGGTAVTASSGSVFGFNTCVSLQTITYPTTMTSIVTLSITNCYNLVSVNLPTTMALTTLTLTGNASLESITLPTTVGAAITINAIFFNCFRLKNVTIPSGWTLTGGMANAFRNCYALNSVSLPANMNSVTSWNSIFTLCYTLTSVTMPTSMTGNNDLISAFQNCFSIKSLIFPTTMNGAGALQLTFENCYNLASLTMPTSMTSCSNLLRTFQGCFSLQTLTLPVSISANATTMSLLAAGCRSLVTITLPTTVQTSTALNAAQMFDGCPNLNTINNIANLGNPSTTVGLTTATSFLINSPQLTSTVDLYPRLTKLDLQGTATYRSRISNVRLRNTGAGQWTGASPQIDVSYTAMSTAQLNTLFADMAAQPAVVSKTINITSATGAAGLSAGDRLVITSKGWTITG